ncbi:MAG: hypothetical protein LBV42_00525 [Methanobrevibacter sp.]|jgi:glutamine amidotransferase-like uncharacterized protein|nr:hypothetical protein [Methanobrevibacter sp.]
MNLKISGFIILSILIGGTVLVSAVNVAIFTGDGVNQGTLGHLGSTLNDWNYHNPDYNINYDLFNSIQDISQLNGYDVLLVPGGYSTIYQNNLNGNVVHEFVSSGHGYVGICAGAFAGSTHDIDGSTFYGVAPRVETKGIGNMNDATYVNIEGNNYYMQHRGGPQFIIQSGLTDKYDYTNGWGPAIVGDTYGNGWSVLFSPHPESIYNNNLFWHPELLGRAINHFGLSNELFDVKFDKDYYMNKYPDVRNAGAIITNHYIEFGKNEGRYANQILEDDKFDRNYYLNANLDVATSGMDPSAHYIKYGKAYGYLPHR